MNAIGEYPSKTSAEHEINSLRARVEELDDECLAWAETQHLSEARVAELEALVVRNCDPVDATPEDAEIIRGLHRKLCGENYQCSQ